MSGGFIFYAGSSSFLILVLTIFFILIFAELLALYLHMAGFTALEIVLLVMFPLLVYLSALPGVGGAINNFSSDIFGVAIDIPKSFDLPLFHLNNSILGINLVGFSIPIVITLKMLLQRRVALKEASLLIAIISGVTYLYTYFQPRLGIVVYFFAIPPILSAAIAFMLRKMSIGSDSNPALMSYAGATIGVLIGADILNLYKLTVHYYDKPMFISIGGGGVLDAIFLAGIVALFADLIFRSQEEDLIRNFVKIFCGVNWCSNYWKRKGRRKG